MRLLCDRNVAEKYYRAFRQTDWISVRRLGDVLAIDVSDPEIIDHATEHGWVVFTSDVRFLTDDKGGDPERIEPEEINCGVVFYRQAENPSPGDVVAALRKIAQGYDDHSEIREYVPGDWLSALPTIE